MRPPVWNPPIELSASEQKIAQRIRKAKLFLFLRQVRHELFDQAPMAFRHAPLSGREQATGNRQQ